MKKFNKKMVVLILITTLVFSPILATKVYAQFAVVEVGPNLDVNIDTAINTSITAGATIDTAVNTTAAEVKDYGLDAVAWLVANLIIERIAASTVNWINSGFKGKPAYVTNPEAYFGDIADKAATWYIFNNSNLDALCGTMGVKIRLALQRNYVQDPNRWACTITDVVNNVDAFMGDFSKGGWDNFFEISQKQQNNPIGAYLQAEGEMNQLVANKANTALQELNQGQGFLSFKKCKAGAQQVCQYSKYNEQTKEQECQEYDCAGQDKETVTPGSVISDKLNSVLGQSEGRLVMADEINEMISALISQLTEKLLGAAVGGLRGLSNKNPADNNQAFTDQMLTSTSTVDYFGNPPDTSMIDQPIPSQTPDADCNSVDPAVLDKMAQDITNSSGMPFDQARNNLDCDPPGMH